ncbi:MAG: hypothetical protein L3J23_03900 [Flavobacteriaceae bacterium]|nr:hypothetical protein [Flavobacteriaceae bacterium]
MQNNKQHIILTILFLILLITPTLVQLTGIEDKIMDNENRTKKSFPKLNKKQPLLFVKNFKSYYKDNFGLRNTLSNSYLHIKNEVFNESPLPSKVIKGKNNFLFLGNDNSNALNESLGFILFTKTELNQIKVTILERKKWLQEQNIKFYIAIAPSKHSIYKENLPFLFPEKKTRKNQLIQFIKLEIKFDIIDLGKQFKVKKKKNRLYKKLDSHWNDLGAFYASQTLINTLKKDFEINSLKLHNYKIDSIKKNGDLAKMINFKSKENTIILSPLFNNESKEVDLPKYYSQSSIYESRHKNPSKKFKVLLFRDSFSSALKPFINHTFGESTFIWSHKFDKNLILKEKPDLIIMEYVERYLEFM